LELALRTIVDVKIKGNYFSKTRIKTECVSERLRDEPGANISKRKPSRKRSVEELSDPDNKALNKKKSETHN